MYFVKDQYVVGTFDGVKKIAAEICADASSDLPAYNNCKGIDGELTLGTIALVADEAEFYTMTSEGEWHKKGEEPNSNKSSLNSVSPVLIKASVTPDEKPFEDIPEENYTKVSDEDAELL